MKVRSDTSQLCLAKEEGVESIPGGIASQSPAWHISRKPLAYETQDADLFGVGSGDNGGCGTNGPALEKSIAK